MSERHPEISIYSEWGQIDAVLVTHDAGECLLDHCPSHNPSRHPLASAPLRWRQDLELMERICPHGVGHPDVDSLNYIDVVEGSGRAARLSAHTCDLCCVPPDEVNDD